MLLVLPTLILFFFNDTATTEIYTLSLHDALPICRAAATRAWIAFGTWNWVIRSLNRGEGEELSRQDRSKQYSSNQDRKSTRLNSSHSQISYAVFCLKKKKTYKTQA